MNTPSPHTALRASLAALALASGLMACEGRAGDEQQRQIADAGLQTQLALSQAEARRAQRQAAEAAQQARHARAMLTHRSDAPAATPMHPSDAAVARAVQAQLAQHDATRYAAVQVKAARGEVWLSGSVASDAARSRAETLAHAVDGVQAVRNRIDVLVH